MVIEADDISGAANVNVLTNPYFTALGIPFVFILIGALAKKLVRRTEGWRKQDFYLGVETTLATLSSVLVNLTDIVQAQQKTGQWATVAERLLSTCGFLIVLFPLLFVVLSFHQDWEHKPEEGKAQFMRLGIISNLVGFMLLAGFILMVKGIPS